MGFDFSKVRGKEREEEGFRAADRQAKDAYIRKVDTEFWLCVCFPTEAELAVFKEAVGAGGGTFSGNEFRRMTEGLKPDRLRRQFSKVDEYRPRTDGFFSDVDYTDILEVDAWRELEHLLARLESPEPADGEDPTCTPFYVRVFFSDRADKEDYLEEWGIANIGDKYIDGRKWMAKAGKTRTEANRSSKT